MLCARLARLRQRGEGIWDEFVKRHAQTLQPTILLRDNDGKFSPEFDQILQVDGLRVHRITPLSPNLNALDEHWVQSAKSEMLDQFVVFGEAHLRYLLGEFQVYFNERRPHHPSQSDPQYPAENPET